MFRLLIYTTLLLAALAQNPIPRQGNSCPAGTYESGDYCKPFKSSKDEVIIQKSGNDCPTGFYSSGNYCKHICSSDREAIPRLFHCFPAPAPKIQFTITCSQVM